MHSDPMRYLWMFAVPIIWVRALCAWPSVPAPSISIGPVIIVERPFDARIDSTELNTDEGAEYIASN